MFVLGGRWMPRSSQPTASLIHEFPCFSYSFLFHVSVSQSTIWIVQSSKNTGITKYFSIFTKVLFIPCFDFSPPSTSIFEKNPWKTCKCFYIFHSFLYYFDLWFGKPKLSAFVICVFEFFEVWCSLFFDVTPCGWNLAHPSDGDFYLLMGDCDEDDVTRVRVLFEVKVEKLETWCSSF